MAKHTVKFTYGFTFLAAVVFFSYTLFPTGKIQEFIMMTFVRALPDCQLVMGDAKPAFPVALKVVDVKIFRSNQKLMTASDIKIGVPLTSLFSRGKSFSIKSRAYGGLIRGTVNMTAKNGGQSVAGEIKMRDIQMKEITPLQEKLGGEFSGILTGTVTFSRKNPGQQAAFDMNIADAAMPLAISFIRLPDVSFDAVNIQGTVENREISVDTCSFQGSQISGEIAGDITLADPMEKSRLNLTGTVKPHHDLLKNFPKNLIPANLKAKDGVPITIRGTFEKPTVSFR